MDIRIKKSGLKFIHFKVFSSVLQNQPIRYSNYASSTESIYQVFKLHQFTESTYQVFKLRQFYRIGLSGIQTTTVLQNRPIRYLNYTSSTESPYQVFKLRQFYRIGLSDIQTTPVLQNRPIRYSNYDSSTESAYQVFKLRQFYRIGLSGFLSIF